MKRSNLVEVLMSAARMGEITPETIRAAVRESRRVDKKKDEVGDDRGDAPSQDH